MPRTLEQPEVGRLGRRRAQVGDAHAAAGPRDGVPARDVVAILGQALEPAVGDGDPPQLVGAVDRGAECRASGRPSTGSSRAPSPRGQVAAHPGAGHQVVRGRTGSGRRRRRVRAVGGEQPDVVAAPGAALQPVPERRDGARRRAATSERRTSTADRASRRVTRPVSTSTTWMSSRLERRSASRRRFEVKAMRRPSGDQAGSPSAARPSVRREASPGGDVDQPEVVDPVVGEPGAVEHVVEAIDEPVVRWRRRAGARLGLRDRCRGGGRRRPRVAPCEARDDDQPASRRATTRRRRRPAAGRSAGAPRRHRAAGGRPGPCPRGRPAGPSRRATRGRAPPRPSRDGPR